MQQAIQQLASDLAKQINETKIENGYTIICTHRELRYMIEDAIGTRGRDTYERLMEDKCMNDLFEEMLDEHGMFLTVTKIGNIAVR